VESITRQKQLPSMMILIWLRFLGRRDRQRGGGPPGTSRTSLGRAVDPCIVSATGGDADIIATAAFATPNELTGRLTKRRTLPWLSGALYKTVHGRFLRFAAEHVSPQRRRGTRKPAASDPRVRPPTSNMSATCSCVVAGRREGCSRSCARWHDRGSRRVRYAQIAAGRCSTLSNFSMHPSPGTPRSRCKWRRRSHSDRQYIPSVRGLKEGFGH